MIQTGVIHGRFQVLHNDHLRYLLAGKQKCAYLVIGITNPDPFLTRDDPADPHRSLPASNPLTYYERTLMIRAALVEAGVPLEAFSMMPFPIHWPELYRHYLPLEATFFLTIYDQWGEKKLELFQSLNLKTEILWRKSPQEKGIHGALVREKMRLDEPWEHLVPPSTASWMKAWGIPERLKAVHGKRP